MCFLCKSLDLKIWPYLIWTPLEVEFSGLVGLVTIIIHAMLHAMFMTYFLVTDVLNLTLALLSMTFLLSNDGIFSNLTITLWVRLNSFQPVFPNQDQNVKRMFCTFDLFLTHDHYYLYNECKLWINCASMRALNAASPVPLKHLVS